jgi:CheY-like chemotaxis protein
MKKEKSFLLIDDSKATNFFNRKIIEKVECVEEVFIAEKGKQALTYIQSGVIPELIFLDINMPVMNGWEFISEYTKLDKKYKGSIIVLYAYPYVSPIRLLTLSIV